MFRLLSGAALALVLACSPGQARQTSPAPATAAPAGTVDADPALWVLKDADTTIYLFGTVHVLKPGLSWFDEAVRKAFDSSDQLVLELPDPADPQLGNQLLALGMTKDGPTLTEKLPEAKRAAFARLLQGFGMPAAALDRFEPWAAALVLNSLALGKQGFDPNSGVELSLLSAARAANKPVSGLETAEQQFGFFDTLPEALQIAYLAQTIDEIDKLGGQLDGLVTAWAAGKPDELAALMNEGMREQPQIAKVLLADRNAHWADWIAERMDHPGTVFLAVGAGHLAGADSVQAQLAKHKLKAVRVAY